ncbi:hypothetical protein HU200_044055 [Digitaria exilis]|uniref:Glycosyltransferase n=1 Tax=Digitaria exilis TaxID=1010633 RepID=A0A835BA53_9POAL|nr:hypothetical protein HU200_044055 [Digitaria exilis]CAB3492032.1 unnamed protein product [Digitaria exilis]
MDAAAGCPSRPLHVVICPWLGFGHLLPYLELAERLASRGHHVSFVSTPRNLARLPPRRHHTAGGAIDFVTLPLPPVDGLPDGAESTNDVPGDKLEHLWEAFDGLAVPFGEYLATACAGDPTISNKQPDWVLADTFSHWAATAAHEHGVPCAMLQPSAAMIVAVACEATEVSELTGATVYEEMAAVGKRPVAMPWYEWESNSAFFAPLGASGLSIARRCSMALEKSTIAAIWSCHEWELEAFMMAANLLGKPLVPLGLLPPSPDGGRGADVHRDDATVRWLDAQPAKSVVYVALGSEVPLPVELVHELAHGLELSGTRFLWALRKPAGVPDDDVLPAGFRERTHSHGHVAMGWVPQVAILFHAAIGAFLTHCGRNSLIEGIMYGHPLIMLPIFGDQGPNARLMAGRKIGLLVPRNEDDGSFDRRGIEKAVQAVMVEEDSRKVFVANAMKMQEIVANKELHEGYIDEFVQQLRSYITDGNSSTAASPITS